MEVKSNYFAEVLSGRSEAPEWILVLPAGELHTADGLRLVVDQEAMEDILAAFEQRQVDMVVDYEHQTQRGEEAPAAGWDQGTARGRRSIPGRAGNTP